eukprot:TRINITY_DN13782_c0_g1_i1.p1 TRINITY_DN13782_c0_g1~~TRINITY_DN13782_c0_g1_i1.p1  ORF type:complete len:134 (+),score=18.16 TRINITY_DN13782_c0_g1_i1:29-430(+)
MDKLKLTEEEWKLRLTPDQYNILREKGTENCFKGEYDKFFEEGIYECAGCGLQLYTSEQKFDSGCGWPAFSDNILGAVEKETENEYITEITCYRCGGHLGHLFVGEGQSKTNVRHCVNSASLKFKAGKNFNKN